METSGPKKKILIIEDDVNLSRLLKDYLGMHQYAAVIADTGLQGLQQLASTEYDFIILDINLPDIDGIHICQQIREKSLVPIMILSARMGDADKVIALGFGADDYMTKPFSASELVARVSAILRRTGQNPMNQEQDEFLRTGDLRIHEKARTVSFREKTIELSAKEFDLLLFLAKGKNQVFTKEQIWDALWGYEEYGDNNTITVYIRRLREKIEPDPANPLLIRTVWGVGYKLSAGEPG